MDEQRPRPEPSADEGAVDSPPSEDAARSSGAEATATDSPYKNLWVPLIVIPAVVVGVLVLVFALFGQIAGSESGIEANLDRMLTGGKNEREQAAFALVRQVEENREARARGDAEVWSVGPDFQTKLRSAWSDLHSSGDHYLALVVATLMVDLGDPEGIEHVVEYLDLDEAQDPDGRLRFTALRTVSGVGDPELADEVLPLLDSSDSGLRVLAAAVLQRMPGEESVEALRGLLTSAELDLRGTAAISLSHLGDDSGASLLRDLTGLELYEAAHAADPAAFSRARDVRAFRIRAIEALARLGRPEDRGFLEALAADASDIEVREAALRALEAL